MMPELFRKMSVCFILDGCPRCAIICSFIERINIRLPINERIKIINCTYYQRTGIPDHPLILLYNKSFDGFPTLFIKGRKISGSNTNFESEVQIKTLLQDYFIVPEHNNFTFNKECEIEKKGIFKNKVVCN